jgi:hypothetical protein
MERSHLEDKRSAERMVLKLQWIVEMQRRFVQSEAVVTAAFEICGTEPSALVSTFHLSDNFQAVG